MRPRYIFLIMVFINLLNYIDRQILFAVFPLIKTDLHLTDGQLGFLGSAFMIVYMFCAPVIGYFADRTPRQYWIAAGAMLWSAATMAAGTVRNYAQLLIARSFIGAGESGFTGVSPSFVAERFPSRLRARILAGFALAMPLGSALGYILGGWLGTHFGWRNAFFIVGFPGIILGLIVLFKIKDTKRHQNKAEKPKPSAYIDLLKNKPFLFICLSQAMATFTLGGLAAWMPTYLHRYLEMSTVQAGAIFGLITVIAGLIGTISGGLAADKLYKKTPNAYYIISYTGLIVTLPFGIAALFAPTAFTALLLFGIAMVCVFFQTGPIAAAIIVNTDIKIRSMAFALNIFIIHALGDALSPMAMGKFSDAFNLKMAVLFAMLFIIPAAVFAVLAQVFATRGGKATPVCGRDTDLLTKQ